MLTPLERYQQDLQRPDFNQDTAQQNAVRHTQALYEALLAANKKRYGKMAVLVDKMRRNKPEPVRGLYFWGGVGRGKTYLVDNFHESLPFEEKLRMHFHRFMQLVHHELKALKNTQNPLLIVARELAKKTRVICLDEFHVSDITDAMLLSGLLKALFDHRITLVTTSNICPDELYKNGLQRERFLPAINLLNQHTEVVNVDGGVDYRLRALEQAEIYHYPLDAQARKNMAKSFSEIAPEEGQCEQGLEINGRTIHTERCADGVVWFKFQAICDIPRAVADYIELAQCYNTVFVSDIPQMTEQDNDRVLRLINLVDEFYDRNVKLIVSAATAPESLYTGKKQMFPFQRTISRLEEMRSHDYLERPHLP